MNDDQKSDVIRSSAVEQEFGEHLMTRLLHCASFFFFVLFAAGAMLAENPHFNCVPSFPFQQKWQGADAAYSIPLQDGRVAWIFGDTLYGDERLVTGEEPRMVHNTIGISTCKDGKWKIDYTIKKDAKGNPDSFFKPQQNNGTYYWALDGVEHNHELWITLVCVRNVPNSNAFALGFEICGTDLAHVTADWKAIPRTGRLRTFRLWRRACTRILRLLR